MMADRWIASSNGSGKRRWFVSRGNGKIYAENAAGRVRSFGSPEAAETAALKLNRAEGMSAFEGVSADDANRIKGRLLAGDRLADIDRGEVTGSRLRWMRDEVFVALVSDPAAIKALAAGPMLNPCAIVKYTHSRASIRQAAERQAEMFSL